MDPGEEVERKFVPPGSYVPTAASLKRKLKLPFSEGSVRNAVKKAGYRYRSKGRRPLLSVLHRANRLKWAKRMLKAGHDWRRTMCTDEKWFVLEDGQRRCWIKNGEELFITTRQHPEKVMAWGGISLLGSPKLAFCGSVTGGGRF